MADSAPTYPFAAPAFTGSNDYTNRGFTFTVPAGEDPIRTLLRFEIELQRQQYIGDPTKDAAAKAARMAG